jgi:hypothetical protein
MTRGAGGSPLPVAVGSPVLVASRRRLTPLVAVLDSPAGAGLGPQYR